MARRGNSERFSQIWVTQTQLGKHFGLSAREVGQLLVAQGLRAYDATRRQYLPTQRALDEQLCTSTPLKDGTPFYLWHKHKVSSLIQQRTQAHALSDAEAEHRETAQALMRLAKEADETGFDKPYFLLFESIPLKEYAAINEHLKA